MVSEERLEELAAELGVPVGEGVTPSVRRHVDELAAFVDRWDRGGDGDDGRGDSAPASRGSWSDDDYGALLDVYETPRQRRSEGALSGLTVVVKDNIAVEGLRMTCGSRSLAAVPDYDATVVERVLDAGGRVLGKANMDAFAFGPGGMWSEFDPVRSPFSAERIPGGTSSGCGVAVATGLADVGLGSDTGGSVRSPAACCGVVGIKPTHALVPRYGFVGNAPSADVIGPLARDVETAARVLEVIRGPDPRDPTTSAVETGPLDEGLDRDRSLAVGVLALDGHGVTDPVTEAVASLADDLDARGCPTQSVELEMENVEAAYSVVSGAEAAWLFRQRFAQRGGVPGHPDTTAALAAASFNEHVAERVLPGAYLDAVTDGRAYALAREEAVRFERRLDAVFEDVDVLLTPTLRSLPPRYDQMRTEGGFRYTIAKQFNLVGVPAVSVPFAEREGLPVSAQLVAPAFEDRTAIAAARLVERLATDA